MPAPNHTDQHTVRTARNEPWSRQTIAAHRYRLSAHESDMLMLRVRSGELS
jgi:hypothetical protein